jgi:hypothetical protein
MPEWRGRHWAGRLGSQIEMPAQSHDCKLRGNLLNVTEISAGDAAKITTLCLPIFVITIIVLLTVGGGASLAASYNDEGTLALAALVGANSLDLTQQQKTWLALALDGKIASVPPKSGHITVTADHVTCVGFAGDPTNHSCEISLSVRTLRSRLLVGARMNSTRRSVKPAFPSVRRQECGTSRSKTCRARSILRPCVAFKAALNAI